MTDAIQFEKHHFEAGVLVDDGIELASKILNLTTLSGREIQDLGRAMQGDFVAPDRLNQIAQSHISELTSCLASPNSTT